MIAYIVIDDCYISFSVNVSGQKKCILMEIKEACVLFSK